MSYQRTTLYQSYVASDIFYKDGHLSPERRLLDKKIRVKVKPRDLLEFRQDLAPEKLRTGKRFEKDKKTETDIFFLQKKIGDNSQLQPSICVNDTKTTMFLPKQEGNTSHNNQNQTRNALPNQMLTSYQDMSITLQSTDNLAFTARRMIKVKPRIQWKSQNSIDNQQYNNRASSRDNKINMLRSNIFFDKRIEHCPITLHKRQNSMDDYRNRCQETNHQNQNSNNDTYQIKKWIDKIDWKTCNTEIHFKETGKKHKSISAFERRLKENESDLSPQKKLRSSYISSLDCKNQYINGNDYIQDKQKMKNLLRAYTKNAAKISKQFENYSSIQGSTFFEKHNSTQLRPLIDKEGNQIDIYQITNVDLMQESKIQRLFHRKGMHMFDIYRKNSINSGRPLLEFKLRINANDTEFNEKIEQLKLDIKALSSKDKLILVKQTKEKRRENTKVTLPSELSRPKSSLRFK